MLGRWRSWTRREVQRCWCWRLWRIWIVFAERGVGGVVVVVERRVVRAEGGRGVVVSVVVGLSGCCWDGGAGGIVEVMVVVVDGRVEAELEV